MSPRNEKPAWAGAVYTTEYTTAATVTVTAVYAKRTGEYIATWRDPAVFEMLADPRHHKAFILLTFIALRARYSKSQSTINGLSTGECLIGDFESCGLTRQEYRTALQLARRGIKPAIDPPSTTSLNPSAFTRKTASGNRKTADSFPNQQTG